MASPVAVQLNELGREHARSGRPELAERAYRAAAGADRGWAVPWFNLGLSQKYRGDWVGALAANLLATELEPDDPGGWWNLGIAATALGEWNVARRAWRSGGIDIPVGEGPIHMQIGLVPVRLPVGEVVWAARIDPARAVIDNVPLPASGGRWRDVWLHDGAPNGYRTLNGHDVPVFDALERLVVSEYSTFIADVIASPASAARLDVVARERGGAAEDWMANTCLLCRACSEGNPSRGAHQHYENNETPDIGIAAVDLDHARAIVAAWAAAEPDAVMLSLTEAPEAAITSRRK